MSDGLRSALDVLSHGVARFVGEVEAERLRLYRLYLQASVTRVSPLALDMAAYLGRRFEDVVHDLSPPRSWPWNLVDSDKADWRGLSGHRFRRLIADSYAGFPTGPLPRGRRPVKELGAHRDPVGNLPFMVVGRRVEVAAVIGSCAVQTSGPLASITIPDPLPDTIALALVGRTVDVLIEHPILADRGYVIESVRQPSPDRGHVVMFGTGLLPYELPWVDALAAELRSGA